MDLAEAYATMDDYPGEPMAHCKTPLEVLEFVAAWQGVTLTQMRMPKRPQHVVHARMMAMYLIREQTGLSYPKIGKMLRRDHSTVIHGCCLIKARMAKWPDFAAQVRRLNAELMG